VRAAAQTERGPANHKQTGRDGRNMQKP